MAAVRRKSLTGWTVLRSRPATDTKRSIFVSIAAQSDNLGDIEIRRIFLDWLRATGCPVKVFVGAMPDAYVNSFGFDGDVSIIRGSVRFQLTFLAHLAVGQAHLAFSPGPQTFDRSGGLGIRARARDVTVAVRPLTNMLQTLAVRATGGKAVSIGRSVRGNHLWAIRFERVRSVISHIYCSRDTVTSSILNRPIPVVPDLAFYNLDLAESSSSPDLLVLSLRGDRSVSDAAVMGAVRQARSHGLEPVFLTQVASDDPHHVDLASRTGCRVISWPDASHAEQMETVKLAYRNASVVVSDRLHALIFGMQAGAVPVAIKHPDTDKLTSALGDLVPLVAVSATDDVWTQLESVLADVPNARRTTAAAVEQAQGRLADLRSDLVSLLTQH